VLDPTHVEETFALVNWIYTHELVAASLEEREVIADITGATKPMTAGMVLACGRRRPMQYMVFQEHGPSLPLLLRLAAPGELAGDGE
jgi:hypothetical protein